MDFSLSDIYSSIHKTANALPIARPATRVRFGEHSSIFKGQGPDFYQIVEYDPDEHTVDQIQWHLSDPDGKVYVREAKITKDFETIIMGDLSLSMMYKLRLLLETIGNIGLTCFHAQDPLGFIGFSDNIIFEERAKVGEGAVYYLIGELYRFFEGIQNDGRGPLGKTNFEKAFKLFASKFSRKKCFLIVISDFIGAEDFVRSLLLQDVASRHEVVFIYLDNPDEFSFKRRLRNPIRITNIETGQESLVPIRKMKQLERELRAKRKEMRNNLLDLGIYSMVLEYSKSGKQYERLYRFLLSRQEIIKSGGIRTV